MQFNTTSLTIATYTRMNLVVINGTDEPTYNFHIKGTLAPALIVVSGD